MVFGDVVEFALQISIDLLWLVSWSGGTFGFGGIFDDSFNTIPSTGVVPGLFRLWFVVSSRRFLVSVRPPWTGEGYWLCGVHWLRGRKGWSCLCPVLDVLLVVDLGSRVVVSLSRLGHEPGGVVKGLLSED